MGCAIGTIRYIIFLFNFLLALIGVGIVVLSVYTVKENEDIVDKILQGQLTTPAVILAIVGGCIFVFAFFGCWGALRENQCMVSTYAVLLLTLFILQLVVAGLAYMNKGQAEDLTKNTLTRMFEKYSTSKEEAKTIDSLQKELHCCGSIDTNTPWSSMPTHQPPDSCYDDISNKNSIYTQGCVPKIWSLLSDKFSSLAKVAIIAAAVQVVGIVFALCLAHSIRRAELRGYA